MNTYVLKPRPPMRAFFVAAIISALGAVLTVVAAAQHAGAVWIMLAFILLALGVVLAVMGWLSMTRMQTYIKLDDKGYEIKGPGVEKAGEWTDVNRVTTSNGGTHLTMYHGEVGRTHIMCPGGQGGAQMAELAQDIADHLDKDRGYSSLG